MFKEAAELGATTIRVDIALSGVFPSKDGQPVWSGVDEYKRLAQDYHLRVLANLQATPLYQVKANCRVGEGEFWRCPPEQPEWWGWAVGEVAKRTRGVIDDFEIINEPNGSWAFSGTAEDYAKLLAVSYDAIHRANPSAHVALGGLMQTGPGGTESWMDAVFATTDADAIHKFDIANVHIRGPAGDAPKLVTGWRHYFASKGFSGPLWVTEAGYPAEASEQQDTAYSGGALAQARYLSHTIPAMLRAGADKVFVTLRDYAPTGPFASEGVLDSDDPLVDNPVYGRRPSFNAVHELATVTFAPAPSLRGTPTARGPTVTIRVRCDTSAGHSCPGSATIATIGKLAPNHQQITGLTTAGRGGPTKRVRIGTARFTVPAGKTIRVTIRLNAAGRKLLTRFGRIPAQLEVIAANGGVTTGTTGAMITIGH